MTNSLFITEDAHILLKQEAGGALLLKGGITSEGFAVIHTFHRGWLLFGYLQDVRGVWWFDGRKNKVTLVSGDAGAFRVLDNDYGLDTLHVYLENKLIPGADPESFTLLEGSPYFAKDKHRLYVKNEGFHIWEDIDVETAVAHMDYCMDKDHVLHLYNSLSYANGSKSGLAHQLRDAYPDVHGWWHASYDKTEAGATLIQGNWFKTERAVFYAFGAGAAGRTGTRQVFNLVRGADPATFKVLDGEYGQDAQGVYCTWRRSGAADAQTFEALGGLFGRDAQNVFYNGYPVAGADPASFTVLTEAGSQGLSKDKRQVYHAAFGRTFQPFGHPDYILEPLHGADPESFTVLSENGSWSVDRERVYQWGNPARKLDRDSFVYLFDHGPESWAADKHGLYNANGRRTVKGIDGKSFRMLNSFWGKDDEEVFCFRTGGVQRAADAVTFRVTDNDGGAEDARFIYTVTDNNTIKKTKKK